MNPYTLYSYRHTHISLVIDVGWGVRSVSERAGHASAEMTLEVSCHNDARDRQYTRREMASVELRVCLMSHGPQSAT